MKYDQFDERHFSNSHLPWKSTRKCMSTEDRYTIYNNMKRFSTTLLLRMSYVYTFLKTQCQVVMFGTEAEVSVCTCYFPKNKC